SGLLAVPSVSAFFHALLHRSYLDRVSNRLANNALQRSQPQPLEWFFGHRSFLPLTQGKGMLSLQRLAAVMSREKRCLPTRHASTRWGGLSYQSLPFEQSW